MSSDIVVPLTLQLSSANKTAVFDVAEPEALMELPPDSFLRSNYVRGDPCTTTINNVPSLSCTGTNTVQTSVESRGQLHREGGWPNTVDPLDRDERIKYCKRQARDELYADALAELVPRSVAHLRINGSIDIYQQYFQQDRSNSKLRAELGTEVVAVSSGVGGSIPSSASATESTAPIAIASHPEEKPYSNPAVVHALHVSTKLAIPASFDGKVFSDALAQHRAQVAVGAESDSTSPSGATEASPLLLSTSGGIEGRRGGTPPRRHGSQVRLDTSPNQSSMPRPGEASRSHMAIAGNTASRCSFVCGSETLSVVVGYCNLSTPTSLVTSDRVGAARVTTLDHHKRTSTHSRNNTIITSSTGWGSGELGVEGLSRRQSMTEGVSTRTQKEVELQWRSGGPTAAQASLTHSAAFSREPIAVAAVWSVADPTKPANVFLSTECYGGGCSAVAASLKDPHIVFGGMSSGVVEVWDSRKGPLPVASSSRANSHRDCITDIKPVITRATECLTCGLDGQVLVWDTRNLGQPVQEESMVLRDVRGLLAAGKGNAGGRRRGAGVTAVVGEDGSGASLGRILAAVSLDYDPLVGGTQKFLVSTAEGKVLSCGRRVNRSSGGSSGGLPGGADRITAVFDATYGPCFTATRCPALPKVFATSGDWSPKLFADELRGPMLPGPMHSASQVLCASWHPVRSSVLVVGTSSGEVCFLDLLRSTTAYSMTVQVSSAPVQHLAIHATGRRAAVTDTRGEVHIVSLPEVLSEPAQGERGLMGAMLEREYARERQRQGHDAPRHSLGSSRTSSLVAPGGLLDTNYDDDVEASSRSPSPDDMGYLAMLADSPGTPSDTTSEEESISDGDTSITSRVASHLGGGDMSALGSTARPPQSPTPANDGPTTPTPDDYDSVPTPVLSHQQPSRPRSTSPNTLLQRLQKGALEQRRLQQAATMEARPHAPKRPATASNASATSGFGLRRGLITHVRNIFQLVKRKKK